MFKCICQVDSSGTNISVPINLTQQAHYPLENGRNFRHRHWRAERCGTLNNCVDSFKYIQLGRHFGEDYQRCQLKLDVAETRLGRWGEAVGVNNDARFASASPLDKAVKGAQGILEDITDCFEAAQKKSSRYAGRASEQELMVYNNNDMNPMFQRLHNRSRDIARRRQKGTSIVKKAAWALYDGKSLEKIVDQISSWVDELEKLFPVEAVHQKLVEIEIEEVDDELGLKTLKDAARGIDPALEDAVGRKVDAIEAKNNAGSVKTEDLARFQLGNVFSEGALRREILVKDQTNKLGGDGFGEERVSSADREHLQRQGDLG